MRQYALADTTVRLGWAPQDVEVIDRDVGLSETSAAHRAGFRGLAQVAEALAADAASPHCWAKAPRRCSAGAAQHAAAVATSRLRWVVMSATRMNRDQFYAVMAPSDDARLRKVLWKLYWRGSAQLRERIEDELRSPEQPKVKPKKELPDPDTVLDEVTRFVKLAKDGAYMAGDRRVHRTERSRWRLTFRRLAGDAVAALQAANPGPAQQAIAELVTLPAR